MFVNPVKTQLVRAGAISLTALLDDSLSELKDGSVVAISSKIVSLCENRVVPMADTDKESLITREAQFYLDPVGKYPYRFTITDSTLISSAGIDSSNSDGYYVLWPSDSQKTANEVRHYLKKRFGLERVGVVITDSTSKPLRLGTTGVALAHSGFAALNNYVGSDDLFGRTFVVSRANVAEGLAATAVMVMGEGTEQTPLCVISDAGFVTFLDRDPTAEELSTLYFPLEDDVFAPLIATAPWKRGKGKKR
jgi:F420-0:gamma-glutamyl ligase